MNWENFAIPEVVMAVLITGVVTWLVARQNRGHESIERGSDRDHQRELQDDELSAQKERQASEQAHRETMQSSEREHQQLLRREADHAAARDRFTPEASKVRNWVEVQLLQHVDSEEYDFVYTGAHEVEVALDGPAAAIAILGQIAREHPTRQVRDHADKLESDIHGAYNTIDLAGDAREADGSYVDRPTEDDLWRWRGGVRELLDLLHVDAEAKSETRSLEDPPGAQQA